MTATVHRGACQCGGVAFEAEGPLRPVIVCHCRQCRRISGHHSASFDVDPDRIAWLVRDGLASYAGPGGSVRGFCRTCGSSLTFTDAAGRVSVEAGAVQGPTGGRLAAHIFTADKGDYYRIDDGLPQFPGEGPD